MNNILPEDLYNRLCENASSRKRNTLHRIHNACIAQSKMSEKDFSIKKIAELIREEGGPSEQGLRNKNGEDYRTLIKCWAEYCNTTTRVPKKQLHTTVNDELLNSIDNPTAKALVGLLIAENKKLKRENSLLKEHTSLTIDLRPKPIPESKAPMAAIAPSVNEKLTDTEIESIEVAISEKHLADMGWTVDDYGRIKKGAFEIFKIGFVSALKKILAWNKAPVQ